MTGRESDHLTSIDTDAEFCLLANILGILDRINGILDLLNNL